MKRHVPFNTDSTAVEVSDGPSDAKKRRPTEVIVRDHYNAQGIVL